MDDLLNNAVLVFSLLFLGFEFVRLGIKRLMKWNIFADSLTNFATLAMSIGVNILIAGFYVLALYFFYTEFSITQIPITVGSVIACVILADFVYYWEHRFMHRVGFGWATHTVHHSSPYFNISVAYRFGPLDGLVPIFFHIPLAILGFNPFVIFFAEIFVQLYQTALHTEVIRKLPRPIEAIFNTPSHHRVHHGSNPEYIDKNYAGIFIIWDKMFGTFAEEKAAVVYGITNPINSVNPFVVFFHGFTRLFQQMSRTEGLMNKLALLVRPPGENPADRQSVSQEKTDINAELPAKLRS